MEQHSGIYQLYWSSGHFYIGQSINVKKRWTQHKSSFLNGGMKRHHPKLYSAWNKYGTPSFKTVLYCPKECLNDVEQSCISVNWGNDLLCNTNPSSLNSRGVKRSKPSWQKGKKFTQQHRNRLSESRRKKIGTDCGNHKLTQEQVEDIRNRYVPYKVGSIELAKEFGVSYRTILYVVNNKRYSNIKHYDNSAFNEDLRNKGARIYSYNGSNKTIKQWGAEIGVNPRNIESRLYRGWSIEKTLSTPFKTNKLCQQ